MWGMLLSWVVLVVPACWHPVYPLDSTAQRCGRGFAPLPLVLAIACPVLMAYIVCVAYCDCGWLWQQACLGHG
eukprot:1161133-Pelagomonas_calceolata.AAC.19